MLVEKLNKFKKVVEIAKENGVNVSDTEFLSYVAIMNSLQKDNVKLAEDELAQLVDRVDDIYLDTDEYSNCSIQEIADYCVKHLNKIDDLTNTDILEEICC